VLGDVDTLFLPVELDESSTRQPLSSFTAATTPSCKPLAPERAAASAELIRAARGGAGEGGVGGLRIVGVVRESGGSGGAEQQQDEGAAAGDSERSSGGSQKTG